MEICTTKEQSEKLLSLGLKQETADMYLELTYGYNFENNQYSEEWKPHLRPYSELLEDTEKFNIPIYFKHIIPAWSLSKLFELTLYYNNNILIKNNDEIFDVLINNIKNNLENYEK